MVWVGLRHTSLYYAHVLVSMMYVLYVVYADITVRDLGDGKHDGGPNDPRMGVIEIKAQYITYWLSTVGMAGFVKEVGLGVATGKVANNGVTREFDEKVIEGMRTTSS